MPNKTEEVVLKEGSMAYAMKDKDGKVSFTTLKHPVIISQFHVMIIISLLIFIALAVIIISFFNVLTLESAANQIIEQVLEGIKSPIIPL